MIWSSNNKWGSKLRQKQAPQNRSTPRLLPPTWASAAESPGPKHQGQESPQGSPSLPLGLPKGPEHGATARQWPCERSAPQRVNLHSDIPDALTRQSQKTRVRAMEKSTNKHHRAIGGVQNPHGCGHCINTPLPSPEHPA